MCYSLWSPSRLNLNSILYLASLFFLLAHGAPFQNVTDVQLSNGCYYNYNHYTEGDRIFTNEPCLNCTCHNKMLMCYLRVCPYTKPIGHDCVVEKRDDQCCPIITCPEVPVDVNQHMIDSITDLSIPEKYGCSINQTFYSEGSRLPISQNNPCELCYCIKNKTSCLMQECTLHLEGCQPIYNKGSCCPVRYNCDHDNELLQIEDKHVEMTTTERPTQGYILSTTTELSIGKNKCVSNEIEYFDGEQISSTNSCQHCYCMKGDIVCAVQECEMQHISMKDKTCTPIKTNEQQCCPDSYLCENDKKNITSSIGDIVTDDIILNSFPPSVPGEGNCLLDGETYTNKSKVPTINECQEYCECLNSIIKCTNIDCSSKPEEEECTIIIKEDECCPIYVCGESATSEPMISSELSMNEDHANKLNGIIKTTTPKTDHDIAYEETTIISNLKELESYTSTQNLKESESYTSTQYENSVTPTNVPHSPDQTTDILSVKHESTTSQNRKVYETEETTYGDNIVTTTFNNVILENMNSEQNTESYSSVDYNEHFTQITTMENIHLQDTANTENDTSFDMNTKQSITHEERYTTYGGISTSTESISNSGKHTIKQEESITTETMVKDTTDDQNLSKIDSTEVPNTNNSYDSTERQTIDSIADYSKDVENILSESQSQISTSSESTVTHDEDGYTTVSENNGIDGNSEYVAIDIMTESNKDNKHIHEVDDVTTIIPLSQDQIKLSMTVKQDKMKDEGNDNGNSTQGITDESTHDELNTVHFEPNMSNEVTEKEIILKPATPDTISTENFKPDLTNEKNENILVEISSESVTSNPISTEGNINMVTENHDIVLNTLENENKNDIATLEVKYMDQSSIISSDGFTTPPNKEINASTERIEETADITKTDDSIYVFELTTIRNDKNDYITKDQFLPANIENDNANGSFKNETDIYINEKDENIDIIDEDNLFTITTDYPINALNTENNSEHKPTNNTEILATTTHDQNSEEKYSTEKNQQQNSNLELGGMGVDITDIEQTTVLTNEIEDMIYHHSKFNKTYSDSDNSIKSTTPIINSPDELVSSRPFESTEFPQPSIMNEVENSIFTTIATIDTISENITTPNVINLQIENITKQKENTTFENLETVTKSYANELNVEMTTNLMLDVENEKNDNNKDNEQNNAENENNSNVDPTESSENSMESSSEKIKVSEATTQPTEEYISVNSTNNEATTHSTRFEFLTTENGIIDKTTLNVIENEVNTYTTQIPKIISNSVSENTKIYDSIIKSDETDLLEAQSTEPYVEITTDSFSYNLSIIDTNHSTPTTSKSQIQDERIDEEIERTTAHYLEGHTPLPTKIVEQSGLKINETIEDDILNSSTIDYEKLNIVNGMNEDTQENDREQPSNYYIQNMSEPIIVSEKTDNDHTYADSTSEHSSNEYGHNISDPIIVPEKTYISDAENIDRTSEQPSNDYMEHMTDQTVKTEGTPDITNIGDITNVQSLNDNQNISYSTVTEKTDISDGAENIDRTSEQPSNDYNENMSGSIVITDTPDVTNIGDITNEQSSNASNQNISYSTVIPENLNFLDVTDTGDRTSEQSINNYNQNISDPIIMTENTDISDATEENYLNSEQLTNNMNEPVSDHMSEPVTVTENTRISDLIENGDITSEQSTNDNSYNMFEPDIVTESSGIFDDTENVDRTSKQPSNSQNTFDPVTESTGISDDIVNLYSSTEKEYSQNLTIIVAESSYIFDSSSNEHPSNDFSQNMPDPITERYGYETDNKGNQVSITTSNPDSSSLLFHTTTENSIYLMSNITTEKYDKLSSTLNQNYSEEVSVDTTTPKEIDSHNENKSTNDGTIREATTSYEYNENIITTSSEGSQMLLDPAIETTTNIKTETTGKYDKLSSTINPNKSDEVSVNATTQKEIDSHPVNKSTIDDFIRETTTAYDSNENIITTTSEISQILLDPAIEISTTIKTTQSSDDFETTTTSFVVKENSTKSSDVISNLLMVTDSIVSSDINNSYSENVMDTIGHNNINSANNHSSPISTTTQRSHVSENPPQNGDNSMYIPPQYPTYSEDDYAEEDEGEIFGPGTCRYGGKLYVSAQQIPRDDPCDFCFCFRSDIICLQQSCPPPISGCREEPINGFCCPRYECQVSLGTSVNITTSTTTTSTTLPPHFLSHVYNNDTVKSGCMIQGKVYKIGEIISTTSGPCMTCICGGDGQMKCNPRICSPEPIMKKMVAKAVAIRR